MCGKSSRFQNMIVVDGAIIVKIGQELLRVTFVEIQENMFLSNTKLCGTYSNCAGFKHQPEYLLVYPTRIRQSSAVKDNRFRNQ